MTNKPDHRKAIRLTALNLLARREHSFYELREKLSVKLSTERSWTKAAVDVAIEEVLMQLKAEGLQDDQRFTENYIRFRANKGSGPIKISYELANKGIDQAMIQQNMAAYQDLWADVIAKVIASKTRYDEPEPLDPVQKPKRRLKLERFLQQRGFPMGLIHEALSK